MPEHLLSISAFAKQCGLSRQTLIYYDRTGVLKCHYKKGNGYRYYHPNQIFQVGYIQLWQSMGYSLEQIKLLFSGNINWYENINEKINMIEKQIDKLNEMKKFLQCKLNQTKKGYPVPISELYRLQDISFKSILTKYLQSHQPIYQYPNGIIILKINNIWYAQLFIYDPNKGELINTVIDIPISYQELSHFDHMDDYLKDIEKKYGFSPILPLYLEVNYSPFCSQPYFTLLLNNKKTS